MTLMPSDIGTEAAAHARGTSSGVKAPDKVHGAPGEAGAERGHHNLVALLVCVCV